MEISTFDDLLAAARGQPVAQRLLLVFAVAELPEDSNPAERAAFEAGEGGTLTPVMAADKLPDEVASFAALVRESEQFGRAWSVVFVSTLAGRGSRPPLSEEAEAPLNRMIEMIKAGRLDPMIPFDKNGAAIRLQGGD